MKELFQYQGYYGSAEISKEDRCLFGKILFINDLVLYHADTYDELEKEFISAVIDYIKTCKMVGKEPEKPFKGSFNVRISPDLHRMAAIAAIKENTTLNVIVSKSVEQYLNKDEHPINVERHDHHHHYFSSNAGQFSAKGEFDNFGENKWTYNLVAASK